MDCWAKARPKLPWILAAVVVTNILFSVFFWRYPSRDELPSTSNTSMPGHLLPMPQIVVQTGPTCKLSTSDVAILIATTKQLMPRAKAVYDTWVHYFPKVIFLTDQIDNSTTAVPEHLQYVLPNATESRKPKEKIAKGMQLLYNTFPNTKWYMKADDDTYVCPPILLRRLQPYPSSRILQLGRAVHNVTKTLLNRTRIDGVSFCHGGPGYILSHAAMAEMAPGLVDCYFDQARDFPQEDASMGWCFEHLALKGGKANTKSMVPLPGFIQLTESPERRLLLATMHRADPDVMVKSLRSVTHKAMSGISPNGTCLIESSVWKELVESNTRAVAIKQQWLIENGFVGRKAY